MDINDCRSIRRYRKYHDVSEVLHGQRYVARSIIVYDILVDERLKRK